MITGELKNKIDSLWDIFAAGHILVFRHDQPPHGH